MKKLNVKNNETAVLHSVVWGEIGKKYLWYPISRRDHRRRCRHQIP